MVKTLDCNIYGSMIVSPGLVNLTHDNMISPSSQTVLVDENIHRLCGNKGENLNGFSVGKESMGKVGETH